MTSCHCRGGISQIDRPMGMIPALAHTMSNRPSSDTPDVTAPLQPFPVTHVSAGQDGPAAGLFDKHRRLVEVLLRGHRIRRGVDIGERVDTDDVGALFGQADGMGSSLAPGYAGDECNFAVESSHKAPLHVQMP